VIAESVVGKLGLARTFWPTDDTIPDPHPTGYVPTGLDPAKPQQAFDNTANPPKVVNGVNPSVAAGAGAMIGARRSPPEACSPRPPRPSGSRPAGSTGCR